MALPQQVIDRLSNETRRTPKWSSGLLVFSIGIFLLMVAIYFMMTVGYEPYLNAQIAPLQQKMDAASKSISADQESAFLNFYSEVSNLQTLLKNHIAFTPFFAWLEKNTEANVYYSHIVFSSGTQASLTVDAKTQNDLDQQIAIFESAPEVTRVTVSGVSPLQINGGLWQQAGITLFMNGSVFSYNSI
jgi:hypothetical protein